MSWRERFGGADERAEVAARARALLTAAGVTARAAPALPAAGSSPMAHARAPFAAAPVSPPAPGLGPGPGPVSVPETTGLPPAVRGGWVPGQPVAFGGVALASSPARPGTGTGLGADPVGPGAQDVDPADGDDVLGDDVLGDDASADDVPDPPGLPDLPDLIDDGRGRHARHRTGSVRSPALAAITETATPWRERIRLDPGRRGLVAVAAVVVVVASVAGGVLFRGGPSSAVTVAAASGVPGASAAPVEVDTAATTPAASAQRASSDPPGSAATSTSASSVTVDVAGLVVRPGVYTLPTGSRVEDALTAAGGSLPGADLSGVNRARVLVDGEQIAVAVPGAVAPVSAASAGSTGGAAAGALVDLNTAGLADLDTLPGVGPVLAQAILDWRTDHGRFSSVADLDQVSGIGPATFADLKGLVTV